MNITTEELIKRLYQHEADYYNNGRVQDIPVILQDCKNAADIITQLRSSKKTQKRRRQRTSRRNRVLSQQIAELSAQLEQKSAR